MKIDKYGITLKSLEAAELELIRNWRNAGHVRPYMQFTQYITPAMQELWFSTLDRNANSYFIIQTEEQQVGVVSLKNIDQKSKTAEAGIFIGVTDYLDSMVPVLATIAMMEYAFDTLKLRSLKAKISSSNYKVIVFNESIGYKKDEQQHDDDFHYFTAGHSDFIAATASLRGMLDKLK